MYTINFRQEINATVCRVKYHSEQWHCGCGDDSSMDAHLTGGITIDLTETTSQCRTLAKKGSVTLKDETLGFNKGVKTTAVKHRDFDNNGADLSNTNKNECDPYGWINGKTFEGHVQDVVLKVRTKDGKVMSKDGLQLPCHLEELGCETTSFDPYEDTWEAPDNCLLAIHLKEVVSMIKQGKNYYIVSGTQQHQSVPIRSKNGTENFLQQTSTSIPYQIQFVVRGYQLWWI